MPTTLCMDAAMAKYTFKIQNSKTVIGVTLIELVVVVAISSIILGLAAPSVSEFLIKNRVSAQLSMLGRAITMARASSIYLNQVVTLCRSQNHRQCSGQWHEGIILFADANKDRIMDDGEKLLLAIKAFPDGDRIFWRAFQNRQYLQMNPRGYTRYQNGTFTYCPKEGLKYARAIILNATGRVRYSKDSNNDGINEGADGEPLRC